MCYNLNDECQDLGYAQNAMGVDGKGTPSDHPGNWTDGDTNHLNWGSKKRRRRSLGEKVMSLAFVMLFEALVQHPNQDVQKQLNE